MVRFDTTKYKKRLEQISAELQSKIQTAKENRLLSEEGKAEASVKAWDEARAARVKLEKDVLTDAEQKRASYFTKKEPKQSARDLIRQQAEEAGKYPTLYNDSLMANAQLELFERVLALQERAEWRDIARSGDDRYFTAKLAGNDPDELERIQKEGLPHLSKEARERLSGAFTSRIKTLREERIPVEIKEFDTDVEDFNYSLKHFDRDGTYKNYREKQQPEPENETILHDVSSRGMQQAQGNGSAEG